MGRSPLLYFLQGGAGADCCNVHRPLPPGCKRQIRRVPRSSRRARLGWWVGRPAYVSGRLINRHVVIRHDSSSSVERAAFFWSCLFHSTPPQDVPVWRSRTAHGGLPTMPCYILHVGNPHSGWRSGPSQSHCPLPSLHETGRSAWAVCKGLDSGWSVFSRRLQHGALRHLRYYPAVHWHFASRTCRTIRC